jgi:hypothetical protein
MTAESIAAAVITERSRRDAEWGEQNHPDGTGPYTQPLTFPKTGSRISEGDFALLLARLLRNETDLAATRADVTWRHILLEEVFEALAGGRPGQADDGARTGRCRGSAVGTGDRPSTHGGGQR